MASGLAVVAADCGQISDLVRSGETGILYPPGDLDALTAACEELLRKPKLRLFLGDNAARFIRSHYTWDHNASRVLELAKTLQAARRAQG